MSEFSTDPSGGPELPTATPYEPDRGTLPRELEWIAAGRGESVVLLVDAADDRVWAADAAIGIASGWARAGRRVVLADLHLDEPIVHDRLGEPNLDGVADVFLYGASLSRAARPVPGRGFYLISAGTYAEDPAAVLGHPRWPRIAAGFADAQATLLLFVQAGASGLASLAGWAPTAIVLGAPAGLPDGLRVRAVAAPPLAAAAAGVPQGEPEPFEELEPFGEPEQVEEPAAFAEQEPWTEREPELPPEEEPFLEPDPVPGPEVIAWTDPYEEREDPLLGEYAQGIPASTLPAGAVKEREADLRDPPPVPAASRERELQREEPAGARRRWVRPLVLVLVGAALVYAALYAVDRFNPDLFGRILRGGAAGDPAADSAAPADKAAPAAAPATPAAAPLPYSVQAKAFASLRAARQLVESGSASLPGVPLYVSPELVDRVLYYKVLAGLLPDTTQAAGLSRRVVEAGLVEEADARGTWALVQFTPLAFDLGEYPDLAAAAARVDSLQLRQVPAYAVMLPYSDGTDRWRVYGGAFRDSVGADGMRRMLSDRGIEARLVDRVGAAPPPQE